MLWHLQIDPAPGLADSEGRRVAAEAADLGLGGPWSIRSARGFLVEGQLDETDLRGAAEAVLADPIVETFSLRPCPADETGNGRAGRPQAVGPRVVHVLPRPGVTDPVADSARAVLRDLGLGVDEVRSVRTYLVDGPVDALPQLIRRVLANDAVEQAVVGPLAFDHLGQGRIYSFRRIDVPIRSMDDEALMRTSRDGQLSLSIDEMRTVQAHFQDLGRDPTDCELETIAQTWSEHCSHKTLRGRVELDGEVIDNLLKQTIFKATKDLEADGIDWLVSVFEDNAGVIRFDDEHDVCFKVETHNHPSAIDPYGGANTGIGGVIRDPMGTGLGAKPICNTDVFCVAPPDYPAQALPTGVLHPRRVLKGVVAGVRDYGNRMGIPTVNGAVVADERYLANPLVFCGTVGVLPRGMAFKSVRPGDRIVAVGGRTGRDGIHGATFSSAELTGESEELSGGSVQIGNAITEKMVLDALIRARDLGLYRAITDCGAGGFSSAVGEMGASLGAEVDLERAPLKYEGLSYTEIWISEAQERMVLAVPPEHLDELVALCASEGVEATDLGCFVDTGRLTLRYRGEVVGDLSMHFLHEGRPKVTRKATFTPPPEQPVEIPEARKTVILERLREALDRAVRARHVNANEILVSIDEATGRIRIRVDGREIDPDSIAQDDPKSARQSLVEMVRQAEASGPYTPDLLALLHDWDVCSKEWIVRQYDHEVQGRTVLKPLVGDREEGPGDASVVLPVRGSTRGLAVGCGLNPRYGELDPYAMAGNVIDEAIRNVVAVGADPDRIALLDNFCWGNPERPETLGSLVLAAQGCHDLALSYRTPFISGKDSLYNEYSHEGKSLAIPPTLLISAIGQVPDVRRCVSMDLKEPGNVLLIVGRTKDELGGSAYVKVLGLAGGRVPKVDPDCGRATFRAVHRAIAGGLVRSCHDLSEGGLAVALAEMCLAGGLGAEASLRDVPCPDEAASDPVLLFSESPSRFLLEVRPGQVAEVLDLFEGLPIGRLGSVAEAPRLVVLGLDGPTLIDAPVADLRVRWLRSIDDHGVDPVFPHPLNR